MSSSEEVERKFSKQDDFHPRTNTLWQFRALVSKVILPVATSASSFEGFSDIFIALHCAS